MQRTIVHNGHRIEFRNQSLTGKETVLYDGNIVSQKSTIGGTIHLFKVTEESEEVNYEVEVNLKWHGLGATTTVRRNGIVIFTDR